MKAEKLSSLWYICHVKPRTKPQSGMTIGTVLLMVTVGSMAIFTMVAMAFFHMRFSNVVVNQRSARNIAESALSTALTEVWKSNHYGEERLLNEHLHITSTTDEEAEAFLSFNKEKANEFGVPFSTNNFQSEASVEGGNGRIVPDSTVHLVAVGTCRGAQYKAEALYYVPPYPNAMASTGPVVSSGGLLVAGLPDVAKAVEITSSSGVEESKLEEGHIVSNSGGSQAIFVGPSSQVRGDVVAVGGISVAEAHNILGEVRPNASQQSVPDLDVDSVFTKLENLATRNRITNTTAPANTVVDYFTEATVPLTVQGDLELDGGVLYCRDDLTVQGVVKGHGAIFALGDVQIDSGADLSASDQIALVSKGSMELRGASQNGQFFNGLVYSEEEILASNITIIGAAVVNGNSDSLLQLDNVNLIKTPLSVSLVVGLPSDPVNDVEADFTTGSKKKSGFLSSKRTTTSVSPPDAKAQLQAALAGGLQVTGLKVPSDVRGEEHFSLLFEGVFSRGLGPINSLADLTTKEQEDLELADHRHRFKGGKLYVRYDKMNGVNRTEAKQAAETLKSKLRAALPAPIAYTIKTKKKKRTLIFRSSKTKTQNKVFDPMAGLDIDLDAYLDALVKPQKADNPNLVDMTLNRVFDPAETSKVLLWQGF